jgi:hypothetical protein
VKILNFREWYLKQIRCKLPILVKLANGREFVILSVSGKDDNPVCKTKREYEHTEYAIEQNFNDFWAEIVSLIPNYLKGK